jgi:acyl carrier protein
MALVAALEQEFDCMLEMDDIIDMSSYSKALEIMRNYV